MLRRHGVPDAGLHLLVGTGTQYPPSVGARALRGEPPRRPRCPVGDLTTATNPLLNGTADRDGSLRRGLNYVEEFPTLAAGFFLAFEGVLDDPSSGPYPAGLRERGLGCVVRAQG